MGPETCRSKWVVTGYTLMAEAIGLPASIVYILGHAFKVNSWLRRLTAADGKTSVKIETLLPSKATAWAEAMRR